MKILGISCYYHDSAAALINNGKIIAACEEERFSRVKHDSDFPTKSIEYCMAKAGIGPDDLDWVVFYEKPFLKFERINLTFLQTSPKSRGAFVNGYRSILKNKLWIKETISKKIGVPLTKILFSNHHLSHMAAAFYTSNFKSSALLTCDGVGEWTTTAIGVAKNKDIKILKELKFPHSLGLFYSAFTQFLGFEVNEGEFKVMGLAPYGKPKYVEKVRKMINQSADGSFKLDMKYFNFQNSNKTSFSKEFVKLMGVPPVDIKESDKVVKVYADIASSVQTVLEEVLLFLAKSVYHHTKEKNLCFSGGVALNGVANSVLIKESGFKNIYIQPAAGDSGGALGSALYVYNLLSSKPKRYTFNNAYLGYQETEKEIENFIKLNDIKALHLSDSELIQKVSSLLYKQKVVGWVRGRAEWGPRALGSRSILADPRKIKTRYLVNSKIKFREAFRPFAPVCLYEDGKKYFDFNNYQQPLEYMLAVVPVKPKWRYKLGAVTHVDGTARPQFVKRSVNPVYYDLIKSFGKKSGVNVLLNTSFNLKGEPIVNNSLDAYSTFLRSGIDALVLGNYLILK